MTEKSIILLALLGYFFFILITGMILLYLRRGRPLDLSLKGLGVEFSLRSMNEKELECPAPLQQDLTR